MAIPQREVFRSEEEGCLTVVYADESGLRLAVNHPVDLLDPHPVSGDLRDVLVMDWAGWILVQTMRYGMGDGSPLGDRIMRIWLAAASGLPRGDDT